MDQPTVRVPEEGAFQSKKFIAFFFVVLVIAAMGITELVVTRHSSFAFTIGIVTIGFVGVGYVLGQAGLERYVRVAWITANAVAGKVTNEGDVAGSGGGSLPPATGSAPVAGGVAGAPGVAGGGAPPAAV